MYAPNPLCKPSQCRVSEDDQSMDFKTSLYFFNKNPAGDAASRYQRLPTETVPALLHISDKILSRMKPHNEAVVLILLRIWSLMCSRAGTGTGRNHCLTAITMQ